ncbi:MULTISPECIES: hypothetical protein [unclassified Symbiopectobacterium]|uniref:hypothetical protein n=2 Tax=Symbiopectobacterium TaxID=801 RepID=UPI0022269E83|nr:MULTISPECIES: hypothetical protein [unclassified Symbiopectobacterium]MCW2474223.1 hypothetical protein [Candidatus Symbiopectobacterium sp. NZEC151]MCW2485460.1 hypothetical protein [Candidatus Symbiopectobacterium sp. NZEC127]
MKKDKSRLGSILPQVRKWASDGFLPRDRVEVYVSGQGHLALATVDLFKHSMVKVKQSLLLTDDNISKANVHMAHAFRRFIYSQLIDLNDMRTNDRLFIYSLDTLTHFMFGAIATGNHKLLEPFHEAIFDSLNGGYGVHDGRKPPISSTLRYAAFGLTIIGDWLGKPLDLDKHALPRDPAWGQLVAHWREPDPEKFLPVLLGACNTHVERIAVTEREANQQAKQFEFNSVFLAVHPTEILAILRLREIVGLTNPAHIDHPLMQTPYAAITCLPGEVTERDELLDRFLEVVRQRDPQVLPSGL